MNRYRPLVPYPMALFADQDQNHHVTELQRSHVQLSARVSELAAEVSRSTQHMSSIVHNRHALQRTSIHRTILFARSRAISALQASSVEFLRWPASLCESESIVQFTIDSKETGCTLQEFSAFASVLSSDSSVRCSLYPSEYYVKFPSMRHTSTLGVLFNTYADICSALEMDSCE